MNKKTVTSRKEKLANMYVRLLQLEQKLTSVGLDEAVEKLRKQLDLWILDMMRG